MPDALAVGVAVAADTRERREWLSVLGEMMQTWRDAWERRAASRPEPGVSVVADDPERCVPLPERECEHCQGEIPADRGRKGAPALYCSDRCRHEAHCERERAVA